MTSAARDGNLLQMITSSESVDCHTLASAIIAEWKETGNPNAREALDRFTCLRHDKSVAMDLIYEEYCLRLGAGENIDPSQFCSLFPAFKLELQRQIELHRLIDEQPSILRCLNDKWPSVSDEFAGYELVEEIGRGAFARVFFARERALGSRRVVVKIARHGAVEANTLGKLRHGNIVPIHSIVRDPASGLSVICMPDCGRTTLQDVLDHILSNDMSLSSPAGEVLTFLQAHNDERHYDDVPEPDDLYKRGSVRDVILYLLEKLASALAHAHGKGILHLDLKPTNVLVTPNGTPMILDFNLAVDQACPSDRLGGTLPYMSPEQLSILISGGGDSFSVDHRSDLFSLGVISYQLLVGQLPFPCSRSHMSRGDNSIIAREILGAQQSGRCLPRAANRELPTAVARLLEKCISFDRDCRPSNASEIFCCIRTELEVQRRRLRRQRRLRNVALGLLLAAVALGTTAFISAASGLPWSLGEENPLRLIERAKGYAESGELSLAILCAHRAVNADPTVEKMALLGYYCSLHDQHGDAIYWYELALKKGGANASLYNNLGYSYLCLNRLDLAKHNLVLALNSQERPSRTLHNLAILELRIAQSEQRLPEESISLVKQAIADRRIHPRVYRDAAVICAFAATFDDQYRTSANEFAARAVHAGFEVEEILQHPDLLKCLDCSDCYLEASDPEPAVLADHPFLLRPTESGPSVAVGNR